MQAIGRQPPRAPDGAPIQQRYCRHAGRDVPAALDVFIVFSMFRLGAIPAGVHRRALDGNAADPRGLTFRDRLLAVAGAGWALAPRC